MKLTLRVGSPAFGYMRSWQSLVASRHCAVRDRNDESNLKHWDSAERRVIIVGAVGLLLDATINPLRRLVRLIWRLSHYEHARWHAVWTEWPRHCQVKTRRSLDVCKSKHAFKSQKPLIEDSSELKCAAAVTPLTSFLQELRVAVVAELSARLDQ